MASKTQCQVFCYVRESPISTCPTRFPWTGTDYVLTVIELLSPANKRPGRGRQLYEDKRLDVLATRTHFVEIDLLRAGKPIPVNGNGSRSHYRILVSRGDRRPNAHLYALSVRQPIPVFLLPLRPGDQEPLVDIGRLIHELYDRASYDLWVDDSGNPDPPLAAEDTVSADSSSSSHRVCISPP